ncbi:MAG: hypothetical protein JNN01_00880 [Opitutaceae bacterium]|nr:hypothetical protein [Opitutaceae bacterium]
MNLPTRPVLAETFSSGQVFLLVLIVGGLVIALVLPALAMYLRYRRRELWHQTARTALEKGQPLPSPEESVGTTAGARTQRWLRDVRTGMILLAVAGGLWLFLALADHRPSPYRFIAAIPGFVGLALILHAWLVARLDRRQDQPRDPSGGP